MERLVMQKLVDWKSSTYRKPLILKGVVRWVRPGCSRNSPKPIMGI